MAYGQGYAGDPRGREAAVEDRQEGPGAVFKTSPEESFSAKPIAQPIAKQTFSPAAPLIAPKPASTKTAFYLDESPAFVEQKSETVFHMDKILRDQGFKDKKEVDKVAAFTPAQRKDWQAQHDKTLGAHKEYAKQKTAWEKTKLDKEKQVIWDKVTELMDKHLSRENLEKLYDSGYTMTQLTSILNPQNRDNIRDVIRHGIATHKYGLTKMQIYETISSEQQLSDYTNNIAAYRFGKTLKPGQNFDDEWTAAVIQEKMNPGSTGININWSAGTEDDLTVGGWWDNLWEAYHKGGLLGNPNQKPDVLDEDFFQQWINRTKANPANSGGAGGMITQVEGGG